MTLHKHEYILLPLLLRIVQVKKVEN